MIWCFRFFLFNDTATTEIYTLSLHDALPIYRRRDSRDPAHKPHAADGRDSSDASSKRPGTHRSRTGVYTRGQVADSGARTPTEARSPIAPGRPSSRTTQAGTT